MSCEDAIHTPKVCQADRRWTDVGAYRPTVLPAMRAIATGSCPMMPSVMTDRRETVPTASGCDVTRWGRAGCNSDGEQTERRAAEAEALRTRVRVRVRPIASGSSPIIRRMSPHRPLPTPMLLGSV